MIEGRCIGGVADGRWRAGEWMWRHPVAEACDLHMMEQHEVQHLLAGRSLTFLGNSISRRTMYALVDALLGTARMKELYHHEPDQLFDKQCHDAAGIVVDITAGVFHQASAADICEIDALNFGFFARPGDVAKKKISDAANLAISWTVRWSVIKGVATAAARRQALAEDNALHRSLQESLPAGAVLVDLAFSSANIDAHDQTAIWDSMAHELPGSETRLATVKTVIRVDLGTLQDRLYWSPGNGTVVLPMLTRWARRPCFTLRCTVPSQIVTRMTSAPGYNPSIWKCSRARYADSLQAWAGQLVPSNHRRVLFSYIFSWSSLESGQIIYLCHEWDERSVGYGADVFIVRPSDQTDRIEPRDFLDTLLRERKAHLHLGGCFNHGGRQVPTIVQRWAPLDEALNGNRSTSRSWARLHQHTTGGARAFDVRYPSGEDAGAPQKGAAAAAVSHALLARELYASATFPLDLTIAVQRGLTLSGINASNPRSDSVSRRVRLLDGFHLNAFGRQFTTQLALNLMRLILSGSDERINVRDR
jgi:hypothetical protein